MAEPKIAAGELRMLRRLTDAASPPPWTALIEGRDLTSGESFIMIGREDDRDEDLYLVRDTGPASAIDHDFVAASRNHMDALLDEIDRLRGELNYHDGQPGVSPNC